MTCRLAAVASGFCILRELAATYSTPLRGGWSFAGITTWSPKGIPVQVPKVDGGNQVPGAALRWSLSSKNVRRSGVSNQDAWSSTVISPMAAPKAEFLTAASLSRHLTFPLANSPVFFPNLRNPGEFTTDASILKKFLINDNSERYFEVRVEALNFFNHPVFGQIINDPASPVFGGINGKTGQRVMQLGARFFF